jgi:hypothetical protein
MVANAKAHVVVDGSMPQEERTRLAAMIGNANAQDTRAFVGQVYKAILQACGQTARPFCFARGTLHQE